MSSYIAVYQTPDREELPHLVTLAEDWLDQTTSAGVRIRNVAMVPRSRQLYVYVEAPSAALGARILEDDGLTPISIGEADYMEWGRLVGGAARGLHEVRDDAGATLLSALLAI